MTASDAIRGRITWRELDDLTRALLADPASRLNASAVAASGREDEAAALEAQQSLLDRWG